MLRLEDILGIPSERKPREQSNAPICNLLDGEWIARGVYRIESRHRIGDAYGALPFSDPDDVPELAPFGAAKRSVFLDLETTGLSGGTGTYAFLCGLGLSDGEYFRVIQLFLEGPAFERNWLDAIDAAIPAGAGLVTYNGRHFDIPMLLTRHVLARTRPSWRDASHLDLLYIARGLYRGRLPSCSLGTVEQRVLGVRRSGVDIPGWQIPQLYADFLRSRDAGPLRGVFYHNMMDIVSLAALQTHANRIMRGESRLGHDLVRAGDIFNRLGLCARARELWSVAAERAESAPEAMTRLAFCEKRAQNFPDAESLFRSALTAFERRSRMSAGSRAVERTLPLTLCVELAKIAEHRSRDIRSALELTDMALEWSESHRNLLGGSEREVRSELEHRRARLAAKIDKISVQNTNR